ncbi:zinc-binding alcohol dehydrogenase family protein [Streptomyces sp. NPDC056361]|uniref:quinone oxidoreductase family protein n=1 Tax=Streptomyces sp. NPDC056361 TaxID=3345795 RepID=UPI0035DBFF8B
MRAIVLDGDDHYRITELDTPVPGPGEVALRVAYAGVQWGDTMVKDGLFPVPRPFVPGFEASGHIVAVGPGVDANRVGEAVTALAAGGAHAEVVVVPAVLALAVGELPLRTAAAFGWSTPTAYDLVHTVARVRAGERVLIHGAAGAVGGQAAQFARLAGAGRIVGVAGSADRAAYAARSGFDEVLLREDLPAGLGDERFDVVLDPVGGPTRQAGLSALAPHGRLVAYGALGGHAPVLADTDALLGDGRSLMTYNSALLSRTHPERLADSARRALGLLVEGLVSVDVTAEYDPSELGLAVRRLREGATRGKSLLRVAGRFDTPSGAAGA